MDTKREGVPEIIENDANIIELEEALTEAGFGWFNIKHCLVQALALITAIIEINGYSYVLPAAKCDLAMTDSQRGMITSLPYSGIILTSFGWGYVVDTMGRRKGIIYGLLGSGAFGILAALMPEMYSFTVFKFLGGLCICCPSSTPYTFVGEIVPSKKRDQILSITNALQLFGVALTPVLAWGVLTLDFRMNFGLYDFRPWRLLSMIYSSLLILAGVLIYFSPESPKFLMSQGEHDEALKVLQDMYAGNERKSPNEYPIKHITLSESNKRMKSEKFLTSLKIQTVPLLKPPYFKWLMLNGTLLFGLYSVLTGLYMWVPDILNRVIMGHENDRTACEIINQKLNETVYEGICDDSFDQKTFAFRLIANFACAVVALILSGAIKFIDKKFYLLIMYTVMGIFIVLSDVVKQELLFVFFLSSMQLIVVCNGPVNAFSIEIFPTHLRGMAVSLSLMLGRVGSVFGTNLAGALINTACEALFYMFGGVLLVCSFLTLLLPKSKKASATTPT